MDKTSKRNLITDNIVTHETSYQKMRGFLYKLSEIGNNIYLFFSRYQLEKNGFWVYNKLIKWLFEYPFMYVKVLGENYVQIVSQC